MRILHILLAISTLFSSTGVVLSKHICQGELKSAALFVKPHSCHVQDQDSSCHESTACPGDQHQGEDNGCCTNKTDYFKLKQDQKLNSLQLELPGAPPVALPLLITPARILPVTRQLWPAWLNFKPPIVERDIWLKIESILC